LPLFLVLPLSFTLGALKGFTTGLFAFWFGLELDISISIGSRWFNTGILGLILIPLVALMTHEVSEFKAQRELLVARRALSELASSNVYSGTTFKELQALVSSADARLQEIVRLAGTDQSLAEIRFKEELGRIIRDEVRPLSHKIWKQQEEDIPSISWRSQLSDATSKTVQHPIGLGLWLFFGSLGGHANLLGLSDAFWRVLTLSTIVMLTMLAAKQIFAPYPRRSKIPFLISIALATFTGVGFTNLLLGPIQGSSLSLEFAIYAAHLLQSGILLNLIHEFSDKKMRLHQLRLNPNDSELVNSAVERYVSNVRNREFAQLLHSDIQNKLLNSILAAEKHAGVGFDVVSEAGRLRAMLQGFLRYETAARTIGEVLESQKQAWAEFILISTTIDEDLASFQARRCYGLSELISEGISNAIRHGEATQLEISLRIFEGEVLILIRDDGTGLKSDSRGLGTSVLKTLSNDRFSLRSLPSGGTEVQAILPLAPADK
jgi:hypothetical protein